jgi:hypothetical protein
MLLINQIELLYERSLAIAGTGYINDHYLNDKNDHKQYLMFIQSVDNYKEFIK